MDKKILAIVFIVVALAVVIAWRKGAFSASPASGVRVGIGDHVYQVEVVDTVVSMAQGLSGRESLPEGSGMLFVFDPPRPEAFWMKDMRFSIDIIWIRNGKVIGVVERAPVPSGSTIPTFSSAGVVDHVLEVPAGTVTLDALKVGDTVTISGYTRN